MTKRRAVVIADGVAGCPGQFAPVFKLIDSCGTLNGLKVIGNQKDQMPRSITINDTAYSSCSRQKG